ESQLDRFLLRIAMGYPDKTHEIEMLDLHGSGSAVDDLEPVVEAVDVEKMIAVAQSVHVAPVLKGYIVDLATATRSHPALSLGMSPRASLSLQRAARAAAAALGRDYVVPDDIKTLAKPVLGHRLALTPEAQLSGGSPADVVDEVLRLVPVPTGKAT
ncbi:MAG: MoxR-like ATPase, partial [Acidimicrobiaceae bacterium]|nr:MoxR-like ATPase [Acidimicrobiaceae bacterium]